MSNAKKIVLPESEMPRQWYNVMSDIGDFTPPPLDPGTGNPLPPEALSAIFPDGLIEQEVSTERWIDIPDEVLQILAIWRPSPLVRADNLEAFLGTPAHIYYKNESLSPPGSHKPNTAVAQAYFNKKEGVKRLSTETGAGQWGSALSFATKMLGMECTVYMVKISFQQKPYRRSMMMVWGGEVFASPSEKTKAGRDILAADPDCPGSLGMAISEAVEDAVTHDDTKYSLGSVLNHVMLHQTIIGLEAKKQFAVAGEKPDILIGCAGGGSNFAGFVFPFIPDKLEDPDSLRIIAVEPSACPTLTRGPYAYDFGDTAMTTPLLKMFTLGHDFVPPKIHSGGLRYHGMSPTVSALHKKGVIEAESRHQIECFDAAATFAATEGIIIAPETAHAVRVVIDEALKCKKTGEPKTIAFNLSGHGLIDLAAYDLYLENRLEDYEYPLEQIERSLATLPQVKE